MSALGRLFFSLACACGASALAGTPQDGVPVLVHDETLRRTGRNAEIGLLTNRISNLTYVQIRDVDVGSYLDRRYAAQRVPTLEQAFAELGVEGFCTDAPEALFAYLNGRARKAPAVKSEE